MERANKHLRLFILLVIIPGILACESIGYFIDTNLSPSDQREIASKKATEDAIQWVAFQTEVAEVKAANTRLAQEAATEAAFQSMDATVEAEFRAAAQTETPTIQNNTGIDCSVFDGMKVEVAWPTWKRGDALPITFKFPDAVPGLENELPGNWNYQVSVGNNPAYTSQDCRYLGYHKKLHCSVSVPSGFSGSIQMLSLIVEDCNSPVYYNAQTYMPFIEGGGDDHHDDHTN